MEIEIPTIHTERLTLRAFREDDVEPLFELMQDPDVVRYIGDRRIPTRQEVWRGVAAWLGHWLLRDYGLWAVEQRETGVLVGRIGLTELWGHPVLVYGISRREWERRRPQPRA